MGSLNIYRVRFVEGDDVFVIGTSFARAEASACAARLGGVIAEIHIINDPDEAIILPGGVCSKPVTPPPPAPTADTEDLTEAYYEK